MTPIRLAKLIALALTLVASTLTVGAPAASAAGPTTADGYDAPAIDWGPCAGIPGAAFFAETRYECALYPVPLDYADPSGPTIEIAMVKRPADNPEGRKGSLFVNPGGPGGSGFQMVLSAGDILFDSAVTDAYDLIGFDPRGIGYSTALICFGASDNPFDYGEAVGWYVWPDDYSKFREERSDSRALGGKCEQEESAVLDNMSTTDVAHDLETMRRAVGDEYLNFVGYSYGTYIAAVYTNVYPDHVGRVVADGVIDPVEWATGDERGESRRVPTSARLESDVGAQATLDEFFRLCDEAGPETCQLAPDSAARFSAMHERLSQGDLAFNDQDLVSFTLGELYGSFDWTFLAFVLADVETTTGPADETSGFAHLAVRERLDTFGLTQLPLEYFGQEQFMGVTCGDSENPRNQLAWRRASRNSTGYFGPLWAWNDSPCANWRGNDVDRYEGPWNAETANPVLVASTRYDPATDYAGALALHDYLPSSYLLTVEGWGHTTPGLSACADEVTTNYLLGIDPSESETVCTQDLDPFNPIFDVLVDPDSEVVEEIEEGTEPEEAIAEEQAEQAEENGQPAAAERIRRRAAISTYAGWQPRTDR